MNLLKELSRSEEWRVVGLLDDDPAKLGRVLNDVRVLGRDPPRADPARNTCFPPTRRYYRCALRQ